MDKVDVFTDAKPKIEDKMICNPAPIPGLENECKSTPQTLNESIKEDPILNYRTYQNNFNIKIKKIRKNYNESIKEHTKKIKLIYESYNDELNIFLNSQSERFEKILEDQNEKKKRYLREQILKIKQKFENLLNLQEALQKSITDNMILYENLLLSAKDIINSASITNPTNYFISKNIELFLNSWSISKLDYYEQHQNNNNINNKNNKNTSKEDINLINNQKKRPNNLISADNNLQALIESFDEDVFPKPIKFLYKPKKKITYYEQHQNNNNNKNNKNTSKEDINLINNQKKRPNNLISTDNNLQALIESFDEDVFPKAIKFLYKPKKKITYYDLSITSENECLNNEEKKKLIKENIKGLKNLNLENISLNAYYNLFSKKTNSNTETNPENQFSNAKKITMKNCSFNELELYDYFPNLEKLKIHNCKINLYKFFGGEESVKNLKEFYLVNLNLSTGLFNQFIYLLNKLTQIRENLEILSLKNNLITKFRLFNDESELVGPFKNLKEIDLENNNVYGYDQGNFNYTPEITIINLINNNITLDNFQQLQKSMNGILKEKIKNAKDEGQENIKFSNVILASKNLFLLRENERDIYIKYFSQNIDNLNFPLKKFSLDTLINVKNKIILEEFKFNDYFLKNLTYISLSLCSLEDNELINFLMKFKGANNIKKLNVSSNLITENFFKIYCTMNLANFFGKTIEKIDMSSNENLEVKNNYKDMIIFMNINSGLNKLVLGRTSFENTVFNFLKYKHKELKSNKQSNTDGEKKSYKEMENFIKIYEEVGPTKAKIYFKELIAYRDYEKVKAKWEKECKPFDFKWKNKNFE